MFKMPSLIKNSTIKPLLIMILKVAIPTIFFTILLHIYFGPLRLLDILLVSNFFESHPDGFSYWFIEVYIQILLIIFLLVSIPLVRNFVATHARDASFIFVVIAISTMIASESLWDANHLLRRLPWLMLWLVAFGIAARHAISIPDKLILGFLFFLVNISWGINYVLFVGGILLIFNPKVTLPELIKKTYLLRCRRFTFYLYNSFPDFFNSE